MAQTLFNPDKYLTSTVRAIGDFIVNNTDPYLVTVLLEFPPVDAWQTPIQQTIVHLELDDDDPRPVGFANGGMTRTTWEQSTDTVSWEEATAFHRLNFDLGIWAFQEAGGGTARLETQELLKQLFTGAGAAQDLHDQTEGVSLINLTGGAHIIDTINGLPVWRTLNMTLVVEVCGRRTYPSTFEVIGGADQNQQLVIDTNQPVTTP